MDRDDLYEWLHGCLAIADDAMRTASKIAAALDLADAPQRVGQVADALEIIAESTPLSD